MCYTICGFLFEKLFVCYSRRVLVSTRPMLEKKQTYPVKHRGSPSLQVCGSSTPRPSPIPTGGDIMQQEGIELDLSAGARTVM